MQPVQRCLFRTASLVDKLVSLVMGMSKNKVVLHEECTEIDQLIEKNLLQDVGGDQYLVTSKALTVLTPAQTFADPTPIMFYRPAAETETVKKSFTDMNVMELLFTLLDSGWTEQCVNKSKKISPFVQGGSKLVLYHSQSDVGGLHRFYLWALNESESLFDKGVKEIFYFQSEQYYKTLLSCKPDQAPSVRPHQTAQQCFVVILSKSKVR